MSLRIEFTVEARVDLADLRNYLRPKSPQGFGNVISAIERRILTAADFPSGGRPSPHKDIREAIETKYGFVIPYSVSGDTLYVLRVYDGRRKPLDYTKLAAPI